MIFEFTVSVEAEHISGKFASKGDLADQFLDELEAANPTSVNGADDGEYEVTSWEVADTTPTKGKRK